MVEKNTLVSSQLMQKMVERRVSKGNTRERSEALLLKVMEAHETHDNLVYALVYHDFATEKQAEKFVSSL